MSFLNQNIEKQYYIFYFSFRFQAVAVMRKNITAKFCLLN